jgi:hypothetical protein
MNECHHHRKDIPHSQPNLLPFEAKNGWARWEQNDYRHDVAKDNAVRNEFGLKWMNANRVALDARNCR